MNPIDKVKALLAALPEDDLRDLSRFIDGVLDPPDPEDQDGVVATVRGGGGSAGAVTYRQERVKCGKKGCRKCPHGPYVYKYWREDGRLRKAYVGKAGGKKDPMAGKAPTGDGGGSSGTPESN